MTDTENKGPSRGGRPPEAEVSEFSGKQLLTRGLEHLRDGASLLNTQTPSSADLRRALHDVASGIELVLKSFLAAEHWALVFENPATASADDFRKGDFKSVGFVECLKRLQSITPMHVTETHKRELNRMRTKRNQLEHLGIVDNVLAVRAAIGGALHSVVSLVEQAATTGLLKGADQELHKTLAIELSALDDFVTARWDEIRASVSEDDSVTCPACNQKAALYDGGCWTCRFCGTDPESKEIAESFMENDLGLSSYSIVKDGGEWPLYECPECGDEALVGLDEGEFRCFGCNETFAPGTITWCSDCNKPLVYDGETLICSDCFSYKMNRDD